MSLALVYVPVGVVLGWCLFDGVYILCLLLASSVVIISSELTFVYCVSSLKEMESQNVPNVLVMGRK